MRKISERTKKTHLDFFQFFKKLVFFFFSKKKIKTTGLGGGRELARRDHSAPRGRLGRAAGGERAGRGGGGSGGSGSSSGVFFFAGVFVGGGGGGVGASCLSVPLAGGARPRGVEVVARRAHRQGRGPGGQQQRGGRAGGARVLAARLRRGVTRGRVERVERDEREKCNEKKKKKKTCNNEKKKNLLSLFSLSFDRIASEVSVLCSHIIKKAHRICILVKKKVGVFCFS